MGIEELKKCIDPSEHRKASEDTTMTEFKRENFKIFILYFINLGVILHLSRECMLQGSLLRS